MEVVPVNDMGLTRMWEESLRQQALARRNATAVTLTMTPMASDWSIGATRWPVGGSVEGSMTLAELEQLEQRLEQEQETLITILQQATSPDPADRPDATSDVASDSSANCGPSSTSTKPSA